MAIHSTIFAWEIPRDAPGHGGQGQHPHEARPVWASQVALEVKNLPANAGDMALIPGSGRPPGGGNGNPLRYSCLENAMDRGWRTTVHAVSKSRTQLKRPSTANVADIDLGSVPGLGGSPGGRHGNLLQYSCLENPMDREAWWATVHGVAEWNTTEAT